MKITPQTKAPDFTATTIDGTSFTLSGYRGKKILLSFLRNGSCALCNLRVHQLKQHYAELHKEGLEIICVFESSPDDMQPYVGKQDVPFILLSDKSGHIYDLYGAETSQEKVERIIQSGSAAQHIEEAAAAGFSLTPQEGSNFYRMPADFLIDEDFIVQRAQYSERITDHISIDDLLQFAKS